MIRLNKFCVGLVWILLCALPVRAEDVPDMPQRELVARLGSPSAPLILDVRSADEYAAGHLPGAINIPHTEVAAALPRLAADRDRDIVVYCVSGRRAGMAISVLRADGFRHLWHLTGDYPGWAQSGQPIEPPPPAHP
jgi:phage shock protein E